MRAIRARVRQKRIRKPRHHHRLCAFHRQPGTLTAVRSGRRVHLQHKSIGPTAALLCADWRRVRQLAPVRVVVTQRQVQVEPALVVVPLRALQTHDHVVALLAEDVRAAAVTRAVASVVQATVAQDLPHGVEGTFLSHCLRVITADDATLTNGQLAKLRQCGVTLATAKDGADVGEIAPRRTGKGSFGGRQRWEGHAVQCHVARAVRRCRNVAGDVVAGGVRSATRPVRHPGVRYGVVVFHLTTATTTAAVVEGVSSRRAHWATPVSVHLRRPGGSRRVSAVDTTTIIVVVIIVPFRLPPSV